MTFEERGGTADLHLEMENHVELATVITDGIQDLLWIFDTRHFPNRERVVLFQYLP